MKLSETKFRVLFNEHLLKLLDIEKEQIAWIVGEAANMMTTDKWDSNIEAHMMSEELDCWKHSVATREGEKIVLEGVPYPKDFLIVWTPQYPDTLPQPGSPDTKYLDFPTDFADLLNKDRRELGVFKVGEGVNYERK